MTTSTEQLNAAILALNNAASAYNSKKGQIDAAVNAAVAAIPQTKKTFYVNQLTGNNANSGTLAEPLATLRQAFARTPWGGQCNVILTSDYTLSDLEDSDGINVSIVGKNQQKLRFTWVDDPQNPANVSYLNAFRPRGLAVFRFHNLDIYLPDSPGKPITNPHLAGIIGNVAQNLPSILVARFYQVNFFDPGDGPGSVFGNLSAFSVFSAVSTTFPATMPGKIVRGVGGVGVDPNTASRLVVTNQDWI